MPKRKRGGGFNRVTKGAANKKKARRDLEATESQEEREERLELDRNRA